MAFSISGFVNQGFRSVKVTVFLTRLGIVAVNFAVLLILARLLGLAAFGELMVFWAIAMVGAPVLGFGLPVFLLRLVPATKLDRSHAARHSWYVRWIVLWPVAMALCISLAAMPFSRGSMIWPVAVSAVLINAMHCVASVQRGLGAANCSMILRDAGPILGLLVAALCAFVDGRTSPDQTLIWFCLITLGPLAFAGWCNFRNLNFGSASPAPPKALWGSSVLGMVASQMDTVVGGAFMSGAETGVYVLLRRVMNLLTLPMSVATWIVSTPIATAFAKDDAPELKAQARRGNRMAFFPALIGACIGGALLPFVTVEATGFLSAALVLGVGVMVQVGLSSTLTIASLCGMERDAMISRLIVVSLYGSLVLCAPSNVTLLSNALAISAAIVIGNLWLWWRIRCCLSFDASVFARPRR